MSREKVLSPIAVSASTIVLLIILFLTGEVGLRLMGKGKWIIRYQPSKTLGWQMTPNQRIYDFHEIRINSFGLRDNEITEKKLDGIFRILVLGDSVTFAKEIKFENTFVQQLERFLNSALSKKKRFQVINASVMGYGTYHELTFLKETGIKFQPDLVILAFVMNDLDLATNSSGYSWSRGLLMRARWSVLYSAARVRFDRFIFSLQHKTSMNEAYDIHERSFEKAFKDRFIDNISDESGKKWAIIKSQILELQQAVKDIDASPIILIIPYRAQVEGDHPPTPQLELIEFCLRNNIMYLDILSKLKNVSEDVFMSPSATHLNEKGHYIIAKELYKELVNRKIISF